MEVGHRWDRGIRVVGETWARIPTWRMWGLMNWTELSCSLFRGFFFNWADLFIFI